MAELTGTTYGAMQSALARKRKLAEMLDAQSFKPNEIGLIPGAKMSWASALAPLLQGYAAKKQGDEADAEEKANAAALEAQRGAIDQMGRGTPAREAVLGTPDTPAQPGANEMFGPTPDQGADPLATAFATAPAAPPPEGSGSAMLAQKLLGENAPPPVEPQGGPGSAFNIAQGVSPTEPAPLKDAGGTQFMIPQRGGVDAIAGTPDTPAIPAKPPTAQELMDKGLAYMKLGDPTSMALGKLFSESGMKGLEPQTQQQIAAQALTRETKGEDIKMRMKNLDEQARRTDLTESNRMEINRQRTELEREWRTWQHEDRVKDIERKAAKGAGGGDGSPSGSTKGQPVGTDAETKDFVFRGPRGELFTTGYSPEGKFEQRPYRGNENNIIQPGDKKLVTAAGVTGNQADMLDSYAKRLQDPANKESFSTRANAGTAFSNAIGGFGKQALSGVPAEKQQLRGEITRTLATVVQSLMGAAVSPTEAARNAAWMPQPGDSAEELEFKLRAASAEARKRLEGNAPKVNTAAAKPSAAPAAPKAAAPAAGNVEAERKRLLGKY
jgi:hypothetical protein